MRPCILALATVLTLGTPALATAQSSDDIQEAKKLFADGKELFEDEEYAKAAEAFVEAHELSQRAELLYHIGRSYQRAGQLADAEKYFQQYLASAPDAANADEVVDAIVEIQQRIAAELATVRVDTEQDGLQLFVDDDEQSRCSTPCSITIRPGLHRIKIRGEDGRERVEEVTVAAAETRDLKLSLDPQRPVGTLLVSSDRDGALEIGERREPLPLEAPLELEVGEYEIAVTSARNARWIGEVRVEESETTELFVPMDALVQARRRGGIRRGVAYGLWGVSVAAGAGGLLLGLQARDTYRDLEADAAIGRSADEQRVQQGRTQQVAANIMFATAATAAATGIGLFVWDLLSD